ncbi:MarR family winged helix-turn-helix transcriptional regulator [Paenibacillus glycinis]|uniref:MarR family transcriptional regulator n=1 Tax=Paenibacillus glycinis TaxID=2697035 RepID=A0ABW9XKH3_9BACL|nr:MarR family transcriptional regulator [Paenibacillus glycinis]NBD23134.1 MarR family transcriptional regulator [Paenibacillus glycinis]
MERWSQKAKNSLKTVENPLHLANGQIFVLFYLHHAETCRVNDVAKILGITSGAATGLTDKLTALGLVERARQEDDRRVVRLSLTAKGKETVTLTRQRRNEWFTGIVGQLEESKLDVVLDAFKLLLDALDDKSTHNKEVER